MARLRELAKRKEHPQDANLSTPGRKALMSKLWVVYAKTPLGGPAQVLEYLSRYTYKTAISNERIKAVSADEVSFTARANDKGGKRRITLPTRDSIRRHWQQVLPGGIKRIRHYGVLANGCKKTQLAQARQALHQPAPNSQATESARDFMARVVGIRVNACPCCQAPLKVVQTLPGFKHLPAPGQVQPATTARGLPLWVVILLLTKSARSAGRVGRTCAQAGARRRMDCSPTAASQKLWMPSPALVANLEPADLDAGDNVPHQRGRPYQTPSTHRGAA